MRSLAINNKQFQNKRLEKAHKKSGRGKKEKVFSLFHFLTIRRMRKLLFSYPTTTATAEQRSSSIVAKAMWQPEWKRNENLFSICIKFCRQTPVEKKKLYCYFDYVIFALLFYFFSLLYIGNEGTIFVVFVVFLSKYTRVIVTTMFAACMQFS